MALLPFWEAMLKTFEEFGCTELYIREHTGQKYWNVYIPQH